VSAIVRVNSCKGNITEERDGCFDQGEPGFSIRVFLLPVAGPGFDSPMTEDSCTAGILL